MTPPDQGRRGRGAGEQPGGGREKAMGVIAVSLGSFSLSMMKRLGAAAVGAATLFGGAGVLNASLFYSDIEDLQATVNAGTCSSRIVYNVPEAHSQGVEVELTVRPLSSRQALPLEKVAALARPIMG